MPDKRSKRLLPSRPRCAYCGKHTNAIVDYCERCKANVCGKCIYGAAHKRVHPDPVTTPPPGNPRDYKYLPEGLQGAGEGKAEDEVEGGDPNDD